MKPENDDKVEQKKAPAIIQVDELDSVTGGLSRCPPQPAQEIALSRCPPAAEPIA